MNDWEVELVEEGDLELVLPGGLGDGVGRDGAEVDGVAGDAKQVGVAAAVHPAGHRVPVCSRTDHITAVLNV